MNAPKQINVDVSKIPNERCQAEGCGNMFWEKTYALKLIPGIMIGQSRSTCTPLEVYRCDKCKTVHPTMLIALVEPELVKN